MTLAAKLRIMAILPLTVLLLTVILYFVTSSRMTAVNEKAEVADEVVKATSDFVLLAFEHSMGKYAERPRIQLNKKYSYVGELLDKAGLSFTSNAERELLDLMRRSYKTIGKILTEVESLVGSSETPIKERDEYLDRIHHRMLIEAQSIIPRADMIHDIQHKDAMRHTKTQTMLTLGFFICLGLCLPIMSLFIMRSIAAPILRLQEGMNNISEGGTEAVVPVTSNDELGKLSQSFNNMAASLKNAHAELKSAYASIEHKVEERTIQLFNANKELAAEIIDRKRTQEALMISEQYVRNVINSSIDIIIATDSERHIVEFNKAAQMAFGYNREEVIGKHVSMLYTTPEEGVGINNTMFNQGQYTGEVVNKRKNNEQFTSYLSAAPLRGSDGEVLGAVGVSRDITDQKRLLEEQEQLQERLQRVEKMESLGTLAGGVAHDLNNVLGIIVGYAEMVLESTDSSNPNRKSLENIMKGGLKAAAIVEDLLTLARRGVQSRAVINVNTIVTDCQKSPEFINLLSHHPAVQIKVDLEPDLLNVSGSAVHLGKSLYNLISNASEAMPNGGAITIRTANQYLDKPIQGYDQVHSGDYVVLSISDMGDGISEHDMKRIFEPFYTKKIMGRSGTGLGLAVVWGTVKDHNGYINVQSEEGKGSTFTLYFPVTREEASTEAPSIPTEEYMGNGESILVVDDVKEQRELAASLLTNLNYNVATASSGEEAVKYLQDHKADLVVLDMIMDPGIDGLDTYRQIIAIHPKQRAIIVSGFSESDRVKEARALGAGAYLKKPYVKERMGVTVRKELDR